MLGRSVTEIKVQTAPRLGLMRRGKATAMPDDERLRRFQTTERVIRVAESGDDDLGPLKDLPGKWESRGRGWNMIALPFARTRPGALNYRLLLNQYNETLDFTLVDKAVPNRGVDNTQTQQTDQFVVTLDY
jgi:hypothetical protein